LLYFIAIVVPDIFIVTLSSKGRPFEGGLPVRGILEAGIIQFIIPCAGCRYKKLYLGPGRK
jgi:hypothetical protein